MPTSEIITKNGLPMLKINDETICPCGYMSYQIDKADYRGFMTNGYQLIFVPVYAGDRGINPMSGIRPFYPGFWVGKDRYDFSVVEENFKKVIADYKPGEIWIIPRVMVEPPSFWEKENPDELCRDFSGKSVHQSYSSEIWFRDTEKAMAALQDFLVKSKIDEYIVGWQIACGWTEEFMRPAIYPLQLTDYSDIGTKAWQKYLKEKYKDMEVLNTEWQTSSQSFDEITVPSPAERVYFPEEETKYPIPVAEYNRFRSVETANALIRLARSAKKIIGGNRVVGAFYGYAGTRFGHDAIDLVLSSPDVDFLASPFAYDTGRAPGTDWVLSGVLGSTRLNGKLWFTECDVRTHLSRPISIAMPHANPIGNTMYDGPIWHGPDSEEVSIDQMKKAFAKTMSMSGGMWWFDMWGGWFQTEKYMDTVKKSLALYASQAGEKPVTSVAVVYDTYARGHHRKNASLEAFLQAIARTGAAFEQFALTDMDKLDPDRYKAIVLLNTHTIVPEIKKWKTGNHSILYVSSAFAEPTDGRACPCKDGTVHVGKGYQEYFFSDVPTSQTLREAFLTAGAHIYHFTDDMIYAYGKMVAIHAASDGEKRIFLPEKSKVKDAYSGEKMQPCDYFFDFTMKKGETRVFVTETEGLSNCRGGYYPPEK